jgi:hypothetical protein
VWVDIKGAAGLSAALNPAGATNAAGLASAQGHGAIALRFSGADLELVGSFHGLDPTDLSEPVHVQAPADAVAAVSISGLGAAVTKQWPTLITAAGQGRDAAAFAAELKAQTGLTLPDDLSTLLGRQFTIAVPASGGQPNGGARVSTDRDAAPALARLGRLMARNLGGPRLVTTKTSDGYAMSFDDATTTSMAGNDGLATTAGFAAAIPTSAQATAVVYVNFAKLIDAFGSGMSDQIRESLQPLQSFGVSVTPDGPDGRKVSMRLTTR